MEKTTIIFDCFGVIASKPMEAWFKSNLESDLDYFHDCIHRFDLGLVSEMELMTELGEKVGKPAEQVLREIDSHFILDEDVVSYILRLKENGYKVGFLSNGNHETFERRVLATRPWFKPIFNAFIVSSEIGLVKPDPKIYHYILEVIKSKEQETVFIDDNQQNIDGANSVGITGILYESLDKLKNDILTLEYNY